MKKVGLYLLLGLFLAFVGVLFSDLCGDFFNGMDYGSACAVGMGAYLCIIVVVCTGLILSKLSALSKGGSGDGR